MIPDLGNSEFADEQAPGSIFGCPKQMAPSNHGGAGDPETVAKMDSKALSPGTLSCSWHMIMSMSRPYHPATSTKSALHDEC